jgi:PadR family transcriptional regulator PadR
MSKEEQILIAEMLEKNKSQMRKGFLEYCTLLIISKGEIYALDLLKELEKAGLVVVEGTLYPLLNRLRREEILSYKWVESQEGPPRKYYFITNLGKTLLKELNLSFKKTLKTIQTLQKNFK